MSTRILLNICKLRKCFSNFIKTVITLLILTMQHISTVEKEDAAFILLDPVVILLQKLASFNINIERIRARKNRLILFNCHIVYSVLSHYPFGYKHNSLHRNIIPQSEMVTLNCQNCSINGRVWANILNACLSVTTL